jgi:hypothetical protein
LNGDRFAKPFFECKLLVALVVVLAHHLPERVSCSAAKRCARGASKIGAGTRSGNSTSNGAETGRNERSTGSPASAA